MWNSQRTGCKTSTWWQLDVNSSPDLQVADHQHVPLTESGESSLLTRIWSEPAGLTSHRKPGAPPQSSGNSSNSLPAIPTPPCDPLTPIFARGLADAISWCSRARVVAERTPPQKGTRSLGVSPIAPIAGWNSRRAV